MPSVTQRIASAGAVLCSRHGDVIAMANARQQSRQALYREAHQVLEAIGGDAAKTLSAQLQELLNRQQPQT